MLKSLLAVTAGGPDAEATFAAAAAVARGFDAHLAGLYVPPAKRSLGELVVDTGEAMMVFHGGVPTAALDAADPGRKPPTRAELAYQLFAGQAAGLREPVFHLAEAPDSALVAELGRLSDLLVIARPGGDPLDPEPAAVNLALFETGQPVLVVPPGGFPARFTRAVLAWNGSAEAARAAHAALPMLRGCAEVVVLSAGSGDGRADPAALCRYFGHHGVAARGAALDTGGISARARGRALLGQADALGADLLVMGAYAGGRMMQFLGLGGATAKVITACRMPLLMAH